MSSESTSSITKSGSHNWLGSAGFGFDVFIVSFWPSASIESTDSAFPALISSLSNILSKDAFTSFAVTCFPFENLIPSLIFNSHVVSSVFLYSSTSHGAIVPSSFTLNKVSPAPYLKVNHPL